MLNMIEDLVDRAFTPAARAHDEKLAAEIDELRAQASKKIHVIDRMFTVMTSPEISRPQDVAKQTEKLIDEHAQILKDLNAKILQFAELIGE
jgi:hypothetical protein